jgi:lipid A 3-O-deacylase
MNFLALCRQAVAIAAFTACSVSFAQEAPPNRAFVQIGSAEHTNAITLGVTHDWDWQRDFGIGRVSGYWEFSLGRWKAERLAGDSSSPWITQIGITPVIRLNPAFLNERWFVEAGIGANLLTPTYRTLDKHFSTRPNFGDHIALGRRFGDAQEHEVVLRIQHYSNASYKQPNPGENFIQLRYAHAF